MRREARVELTSAYDLFADMGAAACAERARIELEATGGTARSSVPETASDLTPHEAQVARHVADGDTNREAAAKLFLSPPPSSPTSGRCTRARRLVPYATGAQDRARAMDESFSSADC